MEILAEVSYPLEYRAGVKHGNVDSLSPMRFEHCRQYLLIELRDSEPRCQQMKFGEVGIELKISTQDPGPYM